MLKSIFDIFRSFFLFFSPLLLSSLLCYVLFLYFMRMWYYNRHYRVELRILYDITTYRKMDKTVIKTFKGVRLCKTLFLKAVFYIEVAATAAAAAQPKCCFQMWKEIVATCYKSSQLCRIVCRHTVRIRAAFQQWKVVIFFVYIYIWKVDILQIDGIKWHTYKPAGILDLIHTAKVISGI